MQSHAITVNMRDAIIFERNEKVHIKCIMPTSKFMTKWEQYSSPKAKALPLFGAVNRKTREVVKLMNEIKLQFSNPAAKTRKMVIRIGSKLENFINAYKHEIMHTNLRIS